MQQYARTWKPPRPNLTHDKYLQGISILDKDREAFSFSFFLKLFKQSLDKRLQDVHVASFGQSCEQLVMRNYHGQFKRSTMENRSPDLPWP